MASFTGILIPGVFAEDVFRCSATIENAPVSGIVINEIYPVPDSIRGNKTSNLPIAEIENEYDGTKVDSFLDDYYYRIHVTPSSFNLGAMISQIEETFIVWNAYFVSKTCLQIDTVNADEIVLEGLTAPFTLKATGWTEYTITVLLNGSPQFETLLIFDFPDEDPVVTITGNRITLFAYKPETPMSENLEWLTNIIKNKTGGEQRIGVRKIPRQAFRFSTRFENDQALAKLEAALFKWQKRAWGLPIWTEWVEHTATIAAGATSITVNTTNADFRAGGLAVIWKSETEHEVIKIDTVAAGSLSLSVPVINTFTGTKLIMPVRISQMNNIVSRKDTPDRDARIDFNFAVRDNLLITGYAPTLSYKTLPVLTQATYVDGTQDKNSDADIIVTDFETGAFEIYSDNLFNKNSQGHLFKNFSKAAAWNLRKFLHYLNGQQGVVWIPSFKEDMVLTDTIGSADTSFNIQNIGLSEGMGLNALRTHLAFIYPDGSMLLREITGITESGAEEIISIDSALGVEVAPGDVMVSFLDKYRLASDQVEIKWDHVGWNTCEVTFLRVKE